MNRFREVSFIIFIFFDMIVLRYLNRFKNESQNRSHRIAATMVYDYFTSLSGLIWIISLGLLHEKIVSIMVILAGFLLNIFFNLKIKKKNINFFTGEDESYKFFTNMLFYASSALCFITCMIFILFNLMK